MEARLIQFSPPMEHVLVESGSIVGRGLSASVRVDDPSISREHVRIIRQGEAWQIMDLGSSNGSLVNDMPVRGACRLSNGDRIRLGAKKFLFHCGDDAGDPPSSVSGATFVDIPENRQVVLLVADLKGFTPLSTRLSPAALASAVRYWCDECRHIVENRGAVLDKFIGDCAFAWWPGHGPVMREHAVRAAQEILAIAPPPEAVLECGVALHCGEAALCHLPDSSFTLLGADVNTTFRMEALTRQLGHSIIVSGALVAGWPDPPFHFCLRGRYPLKGLPEPVSVFSVDPPGVLDAGSPRMAGKIDS
jgi:adenylate cyclase